MIIGNWKMHKTPAQAIEFVEKLNEKLSGPAYVAVPFPSLMPAVGHVQIGAQNVSEHKSGAYTGEVSAEMIAACGASFVLIGHSERRHIYRENDAVMRNKIDRALEAGLLPILCVGETSHEREAGQTHAVLKRQLSAALQDLGACELVIAYEPVWAIGTGKTATAEIAQEAHSAIRTMLSALVNPEWAAKVTILYGGSVKPSNCSELLSQPDIGGALVGGASLDIESFYQITQG